jgi:hypothetical protein
MHQGTTKFNHVCTGQRIDVDVDDFVSVVVILVAPCHSLISIHTQIKFHIPKLKFFHHSAKFSVQLSTNGRPKCLYHPADEPSSTWQGSSFPFMNYQFN